jgi:hypothetical protein
VLVDGKELSECAAGPVERWDRQYFRIDGRDLLVTIQTNTILEFRDFGQSL